MQSPRRISRALSALAAPFAFALAMPHAALAQQPLFGDFGAPAWSRVAKYFELRLAPTTGSLAKDEVVLVLPVATTAGWDDPVKVFRAMEMYKWGDWMPSNAWMYAPNAGKRVSDGYQYFLQAAFVSAVDADGTAPAAVKNALKRSNEELVYTRAEYNEILQQANDAYDAYVSSTPASQRKNKAGFFKDQRYDVEIATRKQRLDSASQTFEIVTRGIVDPDVQLLKNAQLRFDNPNQKILLPPVREVLNDKDRWQTYLVNYLDKDLNAFLNESTQQTETIAEASSSSQYFETHWSASVSVSFLGLFRVGGASAEQVTREQHIKQNATRIEVSFENIDTVNILRGEWFDQNVIDRFAAKLNPEYFSAVWGPNGQLEMIPKSLLLGRGLSFTIYADSQSLDYLYEHFQAAADAGISLGYWRIGGGGQYSSTKEQTKVQRFADHIVFTDLSGRAKVLAVLAKQYSLALPKPSGAVSMQTTAAQRAAAQSRIEALWTKPDLERNFKGALDKKTLRDLELR